MKPMNLKIKLMVKDTTENQVCFLRHSIDD